MRHKAERVEFKAQPITAKFHGACPACEGHWVPGDTITKTEDGWAHYACPQRHIEDLRAPHPICDVCWLSHAAGACDR